MRNRIQPSLALGYFYGVIAILAPLLGFFAPKGLAPLVIVGSICGILILWVQGRRSEWLNSSVAFILLSFCLWALLSSLWSFDTISSITGSARLFGNILAGGLLFQTIRNLTSEEKKLVLRFFLAGFLITVCIVVFEVVLGSPIFVALKGRVIEQYAPGRIFWLNPAIVVLCLLIWPIVLGLCKKKTVLLKNKYKGFFIISLFIIVLILSEKINYSSGTLALCCGILGAILIFIFGRRVAIAGSIILAIVSFSAPFGFSVLQDPIDKINNLMPMPASAQHRIGIWKFTSDRSLDHPIIGWGMNASKHIPGGEAFLFSKDGKLYGRALPLHPHNAILQIWLELGLPGIILFVGLCLLIIIASINPIRSRFESAIIFGQLVTILGIANLSFGMWQAWWIAAIWLSAGFMALVTETGRGADS